MHSRLGWLVLWLCISTACVADEAIQNYTQSMNVNGKFITARVMKIKIDKVRFAVGLARDQVGATEDMMAIAKRNNAIAAINGCFFEAYVQEAYKPPIFFLMHEGKIVYDEPTMGTLLGFGPNNEVRMMRTPEIYQLLGSTDPFWGQLKEAMACGPRLVTLGQVTVDPRSEGFRDQKVLSMSAGRSAIGITSDGWMLLVITRGTIRELAEQMQKLGAIDAMNLDGGASSGLWLHGKYLVKPGRLLSNILMVLPLAADFSKLPTAKRRVALLAIARNPQPGRDEVLCALSDPDPSVRLLALDVLIACPDPRAAVSLLPLLQGSNAQTRRAEIVILKLGNAMVMPLFDLLKRSRGNDTIKPLELLEKLDDPSVIRPLLQYVAEKMKSEDGLSGDYSRILGQLIVRHPEPLLEILQQPKLPEWWEGTYFVPETLTTEQRAPLLATMRVAAQAKNPEIRYRATVLLGRFSEESDLPALLKSTDTENRRTVLEMLCERQSLAVHTAVRPYLDDKDQYTVSYALAALSDDRDPVLIPVLTRLAKHPNEEVRRNALELLAKQHDRQSLTTLVNGLETEKYVSIEVVGALGEMKAAAAIPALISLLSDVDIYFSSQSALAAKKALVNIGLPACEPLMQALTNEDRNVRLLAARALGEVGAPNGSAAVHSHVILTSLRAMWDDKDWRVYEEAAQAIATQGETGVTFLLDALKSKDANIRARAARGLWETNAPHVTQALLACLDDPIEEVRYYASWTLARRKDPSLIEHLVMRGIYFHPGRDEMEEIIHMGIQHEYEMMKAFTETLAETQGVDAIPALAAALKNPKADSMMVRYTLAAIKDDEAILPLIESFAGGDFQAARLLAERGLAAVPALRTALKDPRPRVRQGAADALGIMGDVEMMVPFHDQTISDLLAMAKDPDLACRAQAILALRGFLLPLASLDPLRAALNDPQPLPQLAAIVTLGRQGDGLATPALIRLLANTTRIDDEAFRKGNEELLDQINNYSSQQHTIREVAIHSLGEIGDADAVPALLPILLLPEPDTKVGEDARYEFSELRNAALNALIHIGPPAIDPLLRALADPANATRADDLLVILRDIRDPRIVPELQRLQGAVSKPVADAIARTLMNIRERDKNID